MSKMKRLSVVFNDIKPKNVDMLKAPHFTLPHSCKLIENFSAIPKYKISR
jgi:hypothetical protein